VRISLETFTVVAETILVRYAVCFRWYEVCFAREQIKRHEISPSDLVVSPCLVLITSRNYRGMVDIDGFVIDRLSGTVSV